MHRYSLPAAAAVIAACLAVPSRTDAQQPPSSPPAAPGQAAGSDAEARRKELEEQIRREMGRSTEPRAPEARIAAQGATPGAAGKGGNPLARLMLLPDVSAIASAAASWEDATNTPRFAFEELELALQSVVDPHVRADIFVAFSDEGAEIEEAFVTTLGLPLGLQLRAGKLFAPFGRTNQQHPHVWELVSAPLAQRLLAEEAFGGPGVAVSWLAPLPWFAELHLAAHETAPFEGDEGHLTGVARLLQYVSLGEAATLGVGLSAARRGEGRTAYDAPTPRSQFRDLGGADVYLRIRPPASRSYLTVAGELYARRFVGLEGVSEGFDRGWWAQAFGRAGRFLGAGVRFERAPSESVDGDDQRLSGLVAWLPSEFQRIRLEVSRDRLAGGEKGVSAILAVEFGIGAHGAHPF
jgi:hypothetical protein